MERRQHILNATKGLVGELLYYGRKEDEDLSRGEIQAAIAAGEITAGESVMAKLPDNARHYFNATPRSPAAIIAALYSVPGVRHAFVILRAGEATVVVDSDDLEPVVEVFDQIRPAGVQIDIVKQGDLGTLIDQRVGDAVRRLAVSTQRAAKKTEAANHRALKWIPILAYGLGMLIGWLYGAHG